MSRRVVGNAASVIAVQAGSYILPLVNVPYLLRAIGPGHYGCVALKGSHCLASFLILCALVPFVPRFHSNGAVFFASFGMVVGTMMFPQWFFQGIQKMYWISAFNLAANVVFTIGIYALVHHSSDFVIAAIVQAAGKVVAGVLGLVILFSTERVKLTVPSF